MNYKPWELAHKLRSYPAREGTTFAEWLREAADYLDCLSRVHAELDGEEWGPGTAECIAAHIQACGLTITEPESGED